MRFWKVFYKDDSKQRRVLRVLSFWATQPEPPSSRAELAAATLRFFVPTFKHPCFEAEAEWRLIIKPGSALEIRPKFRVERGLLVPWLEISEIARKVPYAAPLTANTGWFVIKIVCIGPGPSKTSTL